MTDIVERLRATHLMKHGNLMQEAADEIERLRDENSRLREMIKRLRDG